MMGRTGMVAAFVAVALAAGSAGRVVIAHAASLPITTADLTVFTPGPLPPYCPTQTLVATSDTWVDQAAPSTTHGSDVRLTVRSYTASVLIIGLSPENARALIRFELPPAPEGCTLGAATLRVNNSAATTSRTISAVRANAPWSEAGTTWSNQPATAGTAINAAAATGWMQWSVTDHVLSMQSDTNYGFVLRDSAEGSSSSHRQQFDSRDTSQPPELTLQWQ